LFFESPFVGATFLLGVVAVLEMLVGHGTAGISQTMFSHPICQVAVRLGILTFCSVCIWTCLKIQGQHAQDTGHISKVLAVTLGFDEAGTPDFHTLLYTTQVEFQPIAMAWVWKLTNRLLLPLASVSVIMIMLRVIMCDLWVQPNPPRADIPFVLLQTIACAIMASVMMRFLVLGGPLCCVLGSYAVGLPNPPKISKHTWHVITTLILIVFTVVLSWDNIQSSWNPDMAEDAGSLVQRSADLVQWIQNNVAQDAVFYSDFVTLSTIKLGSDRAIVIHPQYENKALRARAEEIYRMYGHTKLRTVARSASALNATHLVLQRRHCEWQTGGGMSFTELVDKAGREHDQLFCHIVHTPPASIFFELIYYNFEYSVFRILRSGEKPRSFLPHRYVSTVLANDPSAGHNLCNYAAFMEQHFNAHKNSEVLYEGALKATNTTQDAQCLDNHAIHLDEDLGLVEPARRFYKAAVRAGPQMGNVLGDYAYFLHLQEDPSAIPTFDKAVAASPQNPHVLCSYAAVLLSNSQIAGARSKASTMYETARKIDPSDQCVRDLANTFLRR